jgi:GTP-binding protein EngB required for normal cell division
MTDLVSLLDLADLAVARSEGVVPAEARRELAEVVLRARRKFGHVGEVLVVALAGGTGSGKSSLINAVLGEEVVLTSVVRPTTDTAVAVVPRLKSDTYTQLLRELGIDNRVETSALKSTILVDLPDFDSTEVAHRHIVESVLPAVDAVIWVFDPEKYSDAVAHDEFLAMLVPYEAQFVFVLNKVDLLGKDTQRLVEDLTRLLALDGFVEPDVVPTIANGEDVDVLILVSILLARLDRKRTVVSKLVTDLRLAATAGWVSACGAAGADADADRERRDEAGLSAATFVWLGVEAIALLKEG